MVEEWCWRHQYDAKDGGIRTNNPNAETLLVVLAVYEAARAALLSSAPDFWRSPTPRNDAFFGV